MPEDLKDHLDRTLCQRTLGWLGLAKRAALTELGFEQVERAARAGALRAMVIADDAGDDGAGKLARAIASIQTVRLFTRVEIGGAVGRQSLVYLGIRHSRLAERMLADAARLAGVRGMLEAATDGGAVGDVCQV